MIGMPFFQVKWRKNIQAFNSKLRKNSSMEIHRIWATKVPEQFLIGEVILKLHLLFNQFR